MFQKIVKNMLFVIAEGCVKFLEKQAKDLGLPLTVYSKFPSKPIVVITWVGQEPASPSILLNSHMDVVPVFEVCITIFGL